ncbi:MAG: alpha/beta hydrolase [Nitrolancea sp.]
MVYRDSTTCGMLDVPGASLCYEVQGTGATLLLIPGGPADAMGFRRLADLLSDTFSVVTYDPRGLSRSIVDDPSQVITVATQADDAYRLLNAVTSEPAHVFGSSGGAITGLELVTKHPNSVRVLIAHEPPIIEPLPDRDAVAAQNEEVYQTYLSQGIGPAMMRFGAMAGLQAAVPMERENPEMREAMERMGANLGLFLGQMLREIVAYKPDANSLSAGAIRVVVARGTTSEGQLAYRTATALADLLGVEPVQFPGDHGGYAAEPEVFARTLRQVLAK